MGKWSLRLVAALAIVAPLAACTPPPAADGGGGGSESSGGGPVGGGRLAAVTGAGKLVCGVEGTIPGFSFVDSSGTYSGLDVDTCRAVAAALFGTSDDIDSKIEFRNLDSTARFPALQNGEVDMLARNTTWTLSRDAAGGNGMEFAPTTFYDGQGIMAGVDSGATSLADMDGQSICVETGTTTELNLATRIEELGITVDEVKFQDSNATFAAYEEGRCEGITSDRSQLAAKRTGLSDPDAHVLLDDVLSKEPLGPVTINNDSGLFDVVKWVTYGLIQAEEFGVTQANVEEQINSESADVKRFLGAEGDLGEQIGLPSDFMVHAIKAAGNYGEIYERNITEQLGIERGLNELWTNGGLLYAPPFR